MTKITMCEVCRQLYDKRENDILLAKSAGKEAIRYEFRTFRTDMRGGDLISAEQTIRAKWDSLISDQIIIDTEGRKPYSWGFLYIPTLEARLAGRSGEKKEKQKVSKGLYIGTYAEEGA